MPNPASSRCEPATGESETAIASEELDDPIEYTTSWLTQSKRTSLTEDTSLYDSAAFEVIKITLKNELLEEMKQDLPGLVEQYLRDTGVRDKTGNDTGVGDKIGNGSGVDDGPTKETDGKLNRLLSRLPTNMLVSAEEGNEKGRASVGDLCKKVQSSGMPILDASANEYGAQDWVYDWSETMWDVMPFVGLNVMATTDSVLVVFVAVLNLVIQIAFIGLVGENMVDSPYQDGEIVDVLRDWRVSYAHNPDFADKFTSTPLGADVCSQSAFLMQGAQQAGLYTEVLEYIQSFLGMPAGACLSTLAIFLWILTCCKEMKRTCLFAVGLWTPNEASHSGFFTDVKHSYVLIQERTVLWVYGEATQKNYQVFLTQCRVYIISSLVVLPRIAILVSLGFVGTRFLVRTTELDELILNCVALEVILNVDELLFAIFAPDSAARMVRKTKPLRIPKLRGVQARIVPWIRVAIVCGLMVYICVRSLLPLINTMTDLETVMCGGKVDFLAVELSFGSVVSGVPKKFGIDPSSYRYKAIYQRTELGGTSDPSSILALENTPFTFTRVQELDIWRDRSIHDWANLEWSDPTLLGCLDVIWVNFQNPDLKYALWAGLSAQVEQDITSCEQLKPWCFDDGTEVGKSVRLMCPVTCGGGDPLSGLMMDSIEDGIPRECDTTFSAGLEALPCTDYPLSVLTNMSHPVGQGWKNFERSLTTLLTPLLQALSLGSATKYQELLNIWLRAMAQGCDAFRRTSPTQGRAVYPGYQGIDYEIDFCDVEELRIGGRRTLRPFCPQACGCDTTVKQRYVTLGETWNERTGKESQCPRKCWTSSAP